MRARVLLICLLATIYSAPSALAQKVIGGLSDRQISIDSSFSGETLTLFGNVEPESGADSKIVEGPFDIIVVINGPAINRVVRKKSNSFGIWINTSETTFENFPSFKWVLASDRLSAIANEGTLAEHHIPLSEFGENVVASGSGDINAMRTELVRLMEEQGLFGAEEHGIQFRSNTLYSGRVVLPSDVPNGNFLAETFLFRNGELISRKAERIVVRKTGFERLIGDSARNFPLLYGLVCVSLAIFTGWMGRLVFGR